MTNKHPRTPRLTTISFRKLLLSTLVITLSMSVTAVIDSLFVGNLIGPDQLAALNMTYPLGVFGVMIYVWIGFGGSTYISVLKGEGDHKESSELFTVSLTALAAIGVVVMLAGSIFKHDLVEVLCSDPSLHLYMIEYIEIFLVLIPILFVFGGFAYFCRVDNFPNLASLSVIVANVVNIALDYVYIEWFDMGIGGAALASLSGYIVGTLLYIFYFRSSERSLHFNLKSLRLASLRLLAKSTRYSTPSALHEGAMFVSLLFVNNMVIGFAGVNGMVIFAVFGQASMLFTLLLTGVAETMAPVVGVSIGEKDSRAIRFVLSYSMKLLYISTLSCFVLLSLFPTEMLWMFGVEDESIIQMGIPVIRILTVSLLPVFFPYFMLFYYQLIKREALSLSIVAFLNIISLLPTMWLLGTYVGSDTIWWALAISEGATAIFILVLSHNISRRSKGRYSSVFLFDKEMEAATLDLTLTTHPSDIEECRLLIAEFIPRNSFISDLFVQEAKMFGSSGTTSIDVVIRVEKERATIRFRHYGKHDPKRSSLQESIDMEVLTYSNQQILNINVITYIVRVDAY